MKVGSNRHQNVEGERIDREEILAMVLRFNEMVVHVHITVRYLAADKLQNAKAAWGLVFPMRPLRGNSLRCIVHPVNACTMGLN